MPDSETTDPWTSRVAASTPWPLVAGTKAAWAMAGSIQRSYQLQSMPQSEAPDESPASQMSQSPSCDPTTGQHRFFVTLLDSLPDDATRQRHLQWITANFAKSSQWEHSDPRQYAATFLGELKKELYKFETRLGDFRPPTSEDPGLWHESIGLYLDWLSPKISNAYCDGRVLTNRTDTSTGMRLDLEVTMNKGQKVPPVREPPFTKVTRTAVLRVQPNSWISQTWKGQKHDVTIEYDATLDQPGTPRPLKPSAIGWSAFDTALAHYDERRNKDTVDPSFILASTVDTLRTKSGKSEWGGRLKLGASELLPSTARPDTDEGFALQLGITSKELHLIDPSTTDEEYGS